MYNPNLDRAFIITSHKRIRQEHLRDVPDGLVQPFNQFRVDVGTVAKRKRLSPLELFLMFLFLFWYAYLQSFQIPNPLQSSISDFMTILTVTQVHL